jgi:hypothetical protein
MQEQNRRQNGRIFLQIGVFLVLSCWVDFDEIKYERFVTEGNSQSVDFNFAKKNNNIAGDSGNCEVEAIPHFPKFGIHGN